jgi:amino acid transporter
MNRSIIKKLRKGKMNTNKRPLILSIASILVAVLVLLSSGLSIAQNFGLMRPNFGAAGFANRRFMPGGMGNLPPGGFEFTPQPGYMPGNGSNRQGSGNFNPNNPDFQGNPNFQNFQERTGFNPGLTSLFRTVMTGLNLAVLVLGLLAAFGLWKQKKWAAILAIILSVVLILMNFTSITSMMRFFSWLIFGEILVKVGLALAVIVLLLLPAARKAYSPVKMLDPDLDLVEDRQIR